MKRIVTAFTLALVFTQTACQKNFSAKATDDSSENTYRKTVVSITTTVSHSKDLPECNESSEGLAAYLAPADKFMKCSAGRWRSITPGSVVSRFASRSHVRFFEWQDQATKKRWSLPFEKEVAQENVSASCTRGWKLPSKEELRHASQNGLLEGIRSRGGRAFTKAWTAEFEVVNGVSRHATFDISAARDIDSKEAGLYCISYASNS